MKYELIKEYPGSPKLGTIEWFECNDHVGATSKEWRGTHFYNFYPEFWQKVEEVDYEILSFKNINSGSLVELHSNNLYCCKESGTYKGIGVQTKEHCINKDSLSIFSVKRLSDGEVFTIGDYFNFKNQPHTLNQKIKEFSISSEKGFKNGIYILYENGFGHIDTIIKTKTPLFTTEDGVEIFEGDSFSWFCIHNEGWTAHNEIGNPSISFSGNAKTFSSKEKAEQYILMNKPCLSLNDIGGSIPNNIYIRLLDMVKSRL